MRMMKRKVFYICNLFCLVYKTTLKSQKQVNKPQKEGEQKARNMKTKGKTKVLSVALRFGRHCRNALRKIDFINFLLFVVLHFGFYLVSLIISTPIKTY